MRSRLQRHLDTLGILWMVVGAIFLFPALALLLLGGTAAHFVIHDNPIASTFGPV